MVMLGDFVVCYCRRMRVSDFSIENISNGFTVDNTSAVTTTRISLNRGFGSLKPNTQVLVVNMHRLVAPIPKISKCTMSKSRIR